MEPTHAYPFETGADGAQPQLAAARRSHVPSWLVPLVLFVATLCTTTLAGAELATGGHWPGWGSTGPQLQLHLRHLWLGLPYMLGFVLFVTCHEFGHYLVARWHRVRTTLPYYLPFFLPIAGAINIGSLGAIIRLKERPQSTRAYFDIGIAGPLAGFVVALLLLVVGFLTLPAAPPHLLPREPPAPDEPMVVAQLGNSLLYWLLEHSLASPALRPPHTDLFHYPLLFAGFIALFFTSLNLLPIGQLDGGHVVYGMFGSRISSWVARATVLGLLLFGGLGMLRIEELGTEPGAILYLAFIAFTLSRLYGYQRVRHNAGILLLLLGSQQLLQQLWVHPPENYIWLFYSFMAVQVIRVDHPRAAHEHRLDRKRMLLGGLALAIFVLCFCPSPITLVELEASPTLLSLLHAWN
ncbi:MAG: site-2 protease family protein [Sphingobacteriia bacterium]